MWLSRSLPGLRPAWPGFVGVQTELELLDCGMYCRSDVRPPCRWNVKLATPREGGALLTARQFYSRVKELVGAGPQIAILHTKRWLLGEGWTPPYSKPDRPPLFAVGFGAIVPRWRDTCALAAGFVPSVFPPPF